MGRFNLTVHNGSSFILQRQALLANKRYVAIATFFFSSLKKNLETAENLKKIIIIYKKKHYYFDNQFILNHLGYFKNVLNGKKYV